VLEEERVARFFEDKATEIQAAAQNSIQKVKKSKNLHEQLAATHVTDSGIPNWVLPVMAIDVENSSQSISELLTSAGHYHNGNANNCTMSVCGNANYNQVLNSISGSAIVNVASDVFAIVMNDVHTEFRFRLGKQLYLDTTRLLHANHKLA
jgi:hypothetical protein